MPSSKLGVLAAMLPADTVVALSEFNRSVKNALMRVPRSEQSRQAVIKYLLMMAARFSKLAGLDREQFIDEAVSCFEFDRDLEEQHFEPQPAKPRCLAS